MLLLLLACTPAPDPCAALCTTAAEVYGACLAEGGLDWEAAGYTGARDFRDACETWAWEQRLLARDAGVDREVLDAACEARAELLGGGGCALYAALDWSEPVWE